MLFSRGAPVVTSALIDQQYADGKLPVDQVYVLTAEGDGEVAK